MTTHRRNPLKWTTEYVFVLPNCFTVSPVYYSKFWLADIYDERSYYYYCLQMDWIWNDKKLFLHEWDGIGKYEEMPKKTIKKKDYVHIKWRWNILKLTMKIHVSIPFTF